MTPVAFLMRVWSRVCRADEDFVFLSSKSTGSWKDHAFKYNDQLESKLNHWIDTHPPEKYDIYFCPTPFSKPERKKQYVKRTAYLWSDIDSGNHRKIPPTLLWESSPNRFQGLWSLNRRDFPAEEAQDLNKALAYSIGGDKGGWDLSQVLRVPGTKNNKYKEKPSVRLVSDTGKKYSINELHTLLGPQEKKTEATVPDSTPEDFKKILSKYKRRIDSKVKRLLMQKHATEGKRSDIIWYLENELSDAGLSPQEVITLIKHSVWNKYKGRADENVRLKSELKKIIGLKSEIPDEKEVEHEVEEELAQGFTIETFGELMGSIHSNPGWLVEGFWTKKSHGIVAGEPKSFKSTLALDLAVSIATGRPFLNKFTVENSGPVLYIQNENAKWIIQDRLGKIISHKGLIGTVTPGGERKFTVEWAPEFPLYLINQQSFMLTDPIHQELLEKIIVEFKPELLILDPLYLMFDGDLNSSKELNPVLTWLIEMKTKHNCGVMLIHHWKKSNGEGNQRGGQRMLGSTTLHGWVESAWYITADGTPVEPDEDDEDVNKAGSSSTVVVDREFRGAGVHPRVSVEISMGEFGTAVYDVKSEIYRPKKESAKDRTLEEVKRQIIELVEGSNGLSQETLKKKVPCGENNLKDALDRLVGEGKIDRGKHNLYYGVGHGDRRGNGQHGKEHARPRARRKIGDGGDDSSEAEGGD